jgi:hypothetical protein
MRTFGARMIPASAGGEIVPGTTGTPAFARPVGARQVPPVIAGAVLPEAPPLDARKPATTARGAGLPHVGHASLVGDIGAAQ